jgi:hypothetical protein
LKTKIEGEKESFLSTFSWPPHWNLISFNSTFVQLKSAEKRCIVNACERIF